MLTGHLNFPGNTQRLADIICTWRYNIETHTHIRMILALNGPSVTGLQPVINGPGPVLQVGIATNVASTAFQRRLALAWLE